MMFYDILCFQILCYAPVSLFNHSSDIAPWISSPTVSAREFVDGSAHLISPITKKIKEIFSIYQFIYQFIIASLELMCMTASVSWCTSS
jgi:hypothetical protein